MIRTLSLILFSLCTSTVAADLVDGGFESPLTNPFSSYVAVAGSPYVLDSWGPETGSPVVAENGITPFAGNQMLRMNQSFSVSQTPQRFDVSSFSTLIDSGNAVLDFGAYFNAPASTPAADARVNVYFHPTTPVGGNMYASPLDVKAAGVIADNDPTTWDLASNSVAVPVNTRSVALELVYVGSSMAGNPGYVDNAFASVSAVPEPSPIMGLGLLCTGIMIVRRVRAVAETKPVCC